MQTNQGIQSKESETIQIRGEDTFTISAANVRLRIKDLKPIIRLAIYKANERQRVETWAWFFGDGLLHKRSRSFHIAITRPLNEEERYQIEQHCRETCCKAKWGSPQRFFQWGVHLQDKEKKFSTVYLDNHPQKWFVKVSNGEQRRSVCATT
jgi:hypothetical protein